MCRRHELITLVNVDSNITSTMYYRQGLQKKDAQNSPQVEKKAIHATTLSLFFVWS
jgi:hypothetical protein